MKTFLRILTGIVITFIIVTALILGPYTLRVQRSLRALKRATMPIFIFTFPPSAKQMAQDGKQVTILVQPNNSGTSSDDPEVHRKDAWLTGFEHHELRMSWAWYCWSRLSFARVKI